MVLKGRGKGMSYWSSYQCFTPAGFTNSILSCIQASSLCLYTEVLSHFKKDHSKIKNGLIVNQIFIYLDLKRKTEIGKKN